MKAIKKGLVYEMIGDTYALFYPYLRNYKSKEKMNVYYKMLTYDNNLLSTIDKDDYNLTKYGVNHLKITERCDNYVTAKSVVLGEGKVFMVNTDGTAFLFDGDGEPMWQGSLKYKNKVPAAIAVNAKGLWGSFPQFDCIVRFNASTMREELRIGKKGDIFDQPKGIFADGNDLYIASFGGKKVLKMDTDDYKITELYSFEEAVYSYVRAKNREFVLLESGLYEL